MLVGRCSEQENEMSNLDQQVRDIAQRHNLSEGSAWQLVNGLLSTGGGQVQFNIPELGGMGQWMPGMVMCSDLFNNALKSRVDTVCADVASMVRSGVLKAPPTINWWPGDLGVPSTSGAQNNIRYAWFPSSRRLAVDAGGGVWVYDTGHHNIGGVSQQQSGSGGTLTFTSQYGNVNLATLPVISRA